MSLVGWVKDTRMTYFGEPVQKTKSNFYYDTYKEALYASRKLLINDKKIFDFVWEYMNINDYSDYKKIFPSICSFRDFENRATDNDPNEEFEDELVSLENFDDFVEIHPFLSYGVSEFKN